jgi:hypothetical protein
MSHNMKGRIETRMETDIHQNELTEPKVNMWSIH